MDDYRLHEGIEDENPCCSITDEFINFLRQRSQAVEAAAQIAAGKQKKVTC